MTNAAYDERLTITTCFLLNSVLRMSVGFTMHAFLLAVIFMALASECYSRLNDQGRAESNGGSIVRGPGP
jgi:hypothetical protein